MDDILVTGAGGEAARMIRPLLRARFGRLILSDRTAPDDIAQDEEFRAADLTDADAVRAALQGCGAVIHLGGQSVEADWDTVNTANIQGMQTLMEAARAQGVSRVIFASSNHAIGFYPRHRRIGTDVAIRPDTYYGVSKIFGEAMCSLYADKFGLRCLSIRIGKVSRKPLNPRGLSIWIHPEDLAQLCALGVTHPDLHHTVVWGASGNARGWWDNDPAHAMGYRPRHNAEDHLEAAMAGETDGPIGDNFMGGDFCEEDFDGDLDRTMSA